MFSPYPADYRQELEQTATKEKKCPVCSKPLLLAYYLNSIVDGEEVHSSCCKVIAEVKAKFKSAVLGI